MKGGSIWDVFGALFNIFADIGAGWVTSGSVTSQPTYGEDTLLTFQEQTPLVSRLLTEVQTGWSLQTIFDLWGPLLQIPALIILTFGTGSIYCTIRVMQIRRMEAEAIRAAQQVQTVHEQPRSQLRWQHVLEQATSDDPQKWRMSILEADHMLNELLDTLGYKGETMGDKMRQADVAAFKTIDFAWEAHQVRNHIAQDPLFTIDAREAKRVIKMYERVFEEFHFIGGEEHSH